MNVSAAAKQAPIARGSDALAASAMRRHGRTFFWASLMLGDARAPIEALYRLCRHIDDIADGDDVAQAGDTGEIGTSSAQRLSVLDRALREEDARSDFVRIALRLRDGHELPLAGLHRLIEEAGRESDFRRSEDADALWRYAFGVAGVVGWMLRPLLGVSDSAATPAAVALGIAMQSTNIARDVIEDAGRGRVYLPRQWAPSIDAEGLLRGDEAQSAEAHVARLRLLDAAEGFYALAERGMAAIPARRRFAIRAAARMYRDIGRAVRAGGIDGMRARAIVPARRKARLTAAVAIGDRPRFGTAMPERLPDVLSEEILALERSAGLLR